jgi:hypothetical protein
LRLVWEKDVAKNKKKAAILIGQTGSCPIHLSGCHLQKSFAVSYQKVCRKLQIEETFVAIATGSVLQIYYSYLEYV